MSAQTPESLVARWAAEAVVSASKAGGRDVEDSAIEVIENRECKHQAVTLEEARRRVTCKGCGISLSPFWVLMGYARQERVFRNSLEMAKADRDRLRKQVEDLKKERTRLQGQNRRAKP